MTSEHDIVSNHADRVVCRCGHQCDSPEAHQRHWDAVVGLEGIALARKALRWSKLHLVTDEDAG